MEVDVPTRAEIIASVIAAVEGVQSASGRPTGGLGETTALFGGIDGFDSLNGLEALVMVGAVLGDELPDKMLEPMRDGTSVTISGLADRILKRMEGENVCA